MNKKTGSIIGICVGVIIIIIGLCVQNTSDYIIGKPIKFGTDFYTEMYTVTKESGRAITDAINKLIGAVGWLIICIGAFDVCYFTSKLAAGSEPKASRRLNASDVETAVSMHLGKPVTLRDIACTLVYVVPQSTGTPSEMHLSMTVGETEFSSLDLMFFDKKQKSYHIGDQKLALDEPWLAPEQIFSFDVSMFKSFRTETDSSD